MLGRAPITKRDRFPNAWSHRDRVTDGNCKRYSCRDSNCHADRNRYTDYSGAKFVESNASRHWG